jgi:hypothetical protein
MSTVSRTGPRRTRSWPLTLALLMVSCTYSTAEPLPERSVLPAASTTPPPVTTSTTTPATTTTAPTTTTASPTTTPPTTTSAPPAPPAAPAAARRRQVVLHPANPAVRVIAARRPVPLAIATSRALVAASPAVVITSAGRRPQRRAADAALALRVPLLLATPPTARAVAAEVRRLGAATVLRSGRLPAPLVRALGTDVTVVDRIRDVPRVRRPRPAASGVALIARGDTASRTALVTARIAGLRPVAIDGGDPRAAKDSRRALQRLAPERMVAIGPPGTFPPGAVLGGLVRTAARGAELPGGGQLLFPGRRLVALYGHPGDPNLGVLGEQSVEASVRRARRAARVYRRAGGGNVVPAFELIATVASAEAGPDGDFSLESSVAHLRPWVDAARAAGLYVVLDLQPGHTDFLTQARRYEELLAQPHVGLALDPEWRLAPGQRHLVDIGSVRAAEVNRVGTWLARLTRRHALPQKLLIVHQFRLDMIRNRDRIRRRPELALVVQMDGHGSQQLKLTTWAAVTVGGPRGVRFGWKNFIDEDSPVRSPSATLALRPSPVFVSYQ